MKKIFLAIILALVLPAAVQAETKKTQAEKVAKHKAVKNKRVKRKPAAKKPRAKPESVAQPEEAKKLDLNVQKDLFGGADKSQIKQDIDLKSEYSPEITNPGDVSVKPEFRIVDNPDITKSYDYPHEKEFKIKVKVGL